LGDVYQARGVLESAAVRALSQRPARESIEELRSIAAEGRACLARDLEDFGPIAGRFHRALVHQSSNVTMSFVVDLLATLTDATYTRQVVQLPPSERHARIEVALRSWEKLIRLIERGDGDGAESHWRKHLTAVGRDLDDDRPLAELVVPAP
jgi:DNA-binding GntR family transcriptional regulator